MFYYVLNIKIKSKSLSNFCIELRDAGFQTSAIYLNVPGIFFKNFVKNVFQIFFQKIFPEISQQFLETLQNSFLPFSQD